MAHFALLWKARAVEKYRSDYEEEKLKSIALAEVGIPRKRLSEKLRSYRLATNETVSRTFSRWFPNGSTVYRCLLYLRSDQSLTAFLLKSIVGFTGGIVLTYLCFIFFVFQLSISFIIATIISSVIGVLLTLGLAFSYRIRCLVFLLIPQLFSRVGRYTLTCYALVLILTGPATNTLKNSEVLSESMACSQEQIKTSVRQINESHKIRYSSIKDNLKAMIEKFEEISKRLTNVTLKINKLVLSIVSSVQATFNWFKSIATNCNHKIGTPYDYCKRLLNEGAKDCKDVLGPDYSWMCNVNYVADATCGDLMKYQSFCGVSQFIDDSILGTVKKKLKSFSDRIASLLYMELHIHNSYSFSSNATSSASQVAAGIVTEIRKRADPLLTWLSWSSCVTSLFLLLIIFRAKYYQQMYDTRSRFDNRYITQELRDLDLKRLREGRETILPLSRRERAKYVTTTSFRLVPSEKVNLNRSAVFMTIATFKLLIHIVADYSLYWILITIQYYGKLQTPVEDELPKISTNVSGTGFKARLLRSLINTLVIPLSPTSDASHTSCLPNPYPPDLRRYMQIGALIFLLWFFTLFEPYGLRLRHVIMGQYRPERAKARATWLYNHILRTRGGFMKFARRKLHREYKYSTEVPLTFRKWITTHIPIKMLRPLFGLCNEDKRCFLCETKEYPSDTDTELIRCKSRNCQGTYCSRCFSDIGHLCTICLSPKDYGDLSDISLEKGSSEESSDTDNSSNEDTQSGSEDRFSSGGVDYKEDDEYFFKNERKSKREWNVFTKTGRREDEIPLLPYTNYKTFQRAPPWDHNDKNDKKIMCIENTLSKLKKVLKDYSKNFIDHNGPGYYTTQKNIKLLKSILHDYENLLKDFATTTICNFKIIMEFFIQYSFYEIRKHSRSLFIIRRRRSSTIGDVIRRQYNLVVRRKIQYTSKRSKKCFQRNVLSNFNKNKSKRDHNNMDGHHFIRKRDKSVQRSSENTFHSNKQKNQRSKKNKNKEKIKKHVRPHKRSDTTKSCFRKYYTLCFGCWRQCKFNMLSCTTQADKSRPILESSKEIKNYKRRKKLNNIDLRKGTSSEKMKTDLNNTRKFRMLSYFSDQEWMRKKSGTTCNMKIESDNEMCNDLKITKSDTTAYKFEDDSSKIARKHKSSVQFHRSLRPKNYPPSEYQKYIDKINDVSNELTKKAIFRFRDAIGLKPQSAISPGQVTDKFTVEERDQREGNFMSPSPQPSTSFSRRIDFYRSLGANEFDDIYDVVNTNERTLLNTLKVIPSSGLRKKKGLSIAIKKNIARDMGFGTVPVAESPSKSHQDSVKGNKKWLHIKLRNPLHMIKEFFSPVTNEPSNEKNRKRKKKLVETVSRGVSASPLMKSFSCQCMPQTGTINIATQTSKDLFEGNPLEPDLVPHLSPMATEIDHKNCTCNISQHTIVQRDMGTCVDHLQQTRRDYKENVIINSTVTSDPSFSDITNVYSLKSNETHRTDTTVLSLPTIDCRKNRRPITRKPKVQVVTRANQSTATEKAIFCDVSTVTDDWWSPIIEKRKIQNSPKTKGQHKNISLEKKRGFIVQNEKIRRRLRNRGMVTDGKVVTFKSRTQIIPAEIIDILSPSRYLLESQKYYNELFLSKYYGGDMVPVLQFQKQKPLGKEKSPKYSRAQSKRLGPTCHRL